MGNKISTTFGIFELTRFGRYVHVYANHRPPSFVNASGGFDFIDNRAVETGKYMFVPECTSCHSNGRHGQHNVLSKLLESVAMTG